eukprot:6770153-Alexandrium_andersonii.AAC.1
MAARRREAASALPSVSSEPTWRAVLRTCRIPAHITQHGSSGRSDGGIGGSSRPHSPHSAVVHGAAPSSSSSASSRPDYIGISSTSTSASASSHSSVVRLAALAGRPVLPGSGARSTPPWPSPAV